MPSTTLLIQPRDPLIFRDGRPFAAEPGARAATLPWPLPGAFAGALRSVLGDAAAVDWSDPTVRDAHLAMAVRGPFRYAAPAPELPASPTRRSGRRRSAGRAAAEPGLCLPAPSDALPFEASPGAGGPLMVAPLRPQALAVDEGCDLPDGLSPVLYQGEELEPADQVSWWQAGDLYRWLAADAHAPVALGDRPGPLPRDIRVHVAIDPALGAAAEGDLFATTGLAFADGEGIVGAIDAPAGLAKSHAAAIGGERRLALFDAAQEALFDPPAELIAAVVRSRWLRLYLATPAVFSAGWRPSFPGPLALPVRSLRAAAVGRRLPVSGWDLARRGPKPVRYLVPQGSVYFVELEAPLTEDAARALWLSSLCDGEQDRRDGYGLVLPGVWEPGQDIIKQQAGGTR